MTTLTWSAPATQAFAAGTIKAELDAIASLLAADPNWAVNASDTTAGWLEAKPRAGSYTADRVLLVGGYTLSSSMQVGGSSLSSGYRFCLTAMADGGAGPNVANITAAGGPYSGATTKFIASGGISDGADSVTICTSQDGIVIAYTESSSGDTWVFVAGRLLQTPGGSDLPMVSGVGANTGGLTSTWWAYLTAAATGVLFTTDDSPIATDTARTSYTDGVTSGVSLKRINGVHVGDGASSVDGGVAFVPIILASHATGRLIGIPRQVKLGGRRIAGIASIEVGSVPKAYGIGANAVAVEDTLWLTQVP